MLSLPPSLSHERTQECKRLIAARTDTRGVLQHVSQPPNCGLRKDNRRQACSSSSRCRSRGRMRVHSLSFGRRPEDIYIPTHTSMYPIQLISPLGGFLSRGLWSSESRRWRRGTIRALTPSMIMRSLPAVGGLKKKHTHNNSQDKRVYRR